MALLLQRVTLGLWVLLLGVGKFQGGLDQFVHGAFASMTPAWLPGWFALPFGYAVPFVEVIFSALLIAGLFTRIAAVVLFLAILSFTIAMAGAGIFSKLGPYPSNIMYLSILFLLTVTGAGRYSVDHLWRGKRR